MFAPWALTTWSRSMSSVADTPVNPSVTPAIETGPTILDTSGPSSPESWARWDPDTRSWRTSQVTFLSGLETYSETWPTSGTMRNGVCYPQLEWEHPTSGEGCSSWPTPRANDAEKRGVIANDRRNGLPAAVRYATPTANVAKNIGPNINYAKRLAKGHLDGQVAHLEGVGGGLNPAWVEWLMGFPIGWTDLPLSATPSSRKSQSGSEAA